MTTRLLRLATVFSVLTGLFSTVALGATTSDSGFAGKTKAVAVAADDQAVSTAGFGFITLTSDNATATNRTITLGAGAMPGHRVTLMLDDTDALELVDTGVQQLNGTWTPTARYETISLVWDGTNWNETGRSFDIVTSSMITDGTIVNADVNSSAAIDSTKLGGFTHTAESVNLIEKMAVVTWTFGTDGGAQATTGLGVTLPDNAVVTKVIEDGTTNCTSAGSGATYKLVLPTDGDLSTNVTCDGTTVAVGSVLPSGTPVKLTAARELSITIGTEAATAGAARWFVYYVQSI